MKTILVTVGLLCSSVSNAEYKMSQAGLDFIKSNEGCILTRDKSNQIGYGHLLKKDEHYCKITQTKANEIFYKDSEWVNEAINRLMEDLPKAIYTQYFIDALGDLIYNCGEFGVKNSLFYKKLQNSRISNYTGMINYYDYHSCCNLIKTFKLSSKYPGLIERREKTYNLITKIDEEINYRTLSEYILGPKKRFYNFRSTFSIQSGVLWYSENQRNNKRIGC